jgi:deazaflavin-dependent oxidoreductase (nitroreductase family)
VPLLHVRDGDAIVLAGSNWGQAHAPAWALNLDANPDAEVDLDGSTIPVRARRATAEERERLWPRLVRVWPGYASYARRAGREIPLFVLERRG